ncbi:rhomboid family intramembrane serine protease [Brachybacterium sp. DNPG3]
MERPTYGYSADDRAGDGADDPRSAAGGARPRPSYGVGDPAQQTSGQPVCPRHPDRVSYVRCKRCDRPACPECQRPTAVGVLCADCERELSRQQASARPRNAMGGRTGGADKPVVTYTIMALCVLAYVGQMVSGGLVEQWLIFSPFRILAYPWTFITAGFLHGSIMHLALNMWALWVVGQHLERVMGHARFSAIYLASIIAGHTAVLLLTDATTQSWYTGTLGASGGVFGLFAAIFIVQRRMGAETAQIAVLIVLNLVITFTVQGISWQGHLGGLVMGGALTAAMFALRPKAAPGADRQALAKRSALIHTAVIASGVLLCLVLIVLRVAMLSG